MNLSLSVWREWIEIYNEESEFGNEIVSLCMERVD